MAATASPAPPAGDVEQRARRLVEQLPPRPDDCLDLADPVCRSEADVNRALQELAWIQAQTSAIRAHCEARVALATAAAEKAMHIGIAGEDPVPFEHRVNALDFAIREFAAEHRDELLADGSKTRVFTHGALSWRAVPEKLELATGTEEKHVLERLAVGPKKKGLIHLVVNWLKTLKFRGIELNRFLRVNVTIAKAQINKEWRDGTIPLATLKAAGYVVTPESETLSIEPHKLTVQAEPTE